MPATTTPNKIKYGIKNVYFATLTSEGATPTYAAPVALPGAKSISLAPQGNREVFYADDSEYVVLESNNGYEGDLELASIPDAFRTAVLGEVKDTKNVLVEKKNGTKPYFALGFEIEGDSVSNLFWFYKCFASRSEEASATTEDSITPQTEKITISAYPDARGYTRVKTTADTTSTDRASFFSSVYAPAGTI